MCSNRHQRDTQYQENGALLSECDDTLPANLNIKALRSTCCETPLLAQRSPISFVTRSEVLGQFVLVLIPPPSCKLVTQGVVDLHPFLIFPQLVFLSSRGSMLMLVGMLRLRAGCGPAS